MFVWIHAFVVNVRAGAGVVKRRPSVHMPTMAKEQVISIWKGFHEGKRRRMGNEYSTHSYNVSSLKAVIDASMKTFYKKFHPDLYYTMPEAMVSPNVN